MWWIFRKLGFSYPEPFDLQLWQNELFKEFPEDEWEMKEWYSGEIKCIDYIKKSTPLTLHMNDCSGMDIYYNKKQVEEQASEMNEIIDSIKLILDQEQQKIKQRESEKQLTLQYMDALNNLLSSDHFTERFYFDGLVSLVHRECFELRMDHQTNKNKAIRLCVLGDPELSFFNNFYDSEDLAMEKENTCENFESNLKKIYSLLKPIISNEIISVSGSRNGQVGFTGIFTLAQANNTKLNSRYYKKYDLDFQVWNGNVKSDIIERMMKN